jgi:hypothetical protein
MKQGKGNTVKKILKKKIYKNEEIKIKIKIKLIIMKKNLT